MEKRKLGNSGIRVSVLGLGCWPLGGGAGWGDENERESIATVHAALDHGIDFLDTAELYNDGRSEEIVGKALRDRRDRALLGVKVPPQYTEPGALRQRLEASLKRLQTDYVDLYQVHWPIEQHSIEDAFATLVDLKAEGKIRAIGISNHGTQQMGLALATGAPIVSNQLGYNLLTRAIETGIMPLCVEKGVSIIAYMVLLQGLLADLHRTPEDVPDFRARTRHFSSRRPGSRHGEEGAEAEVFAALAGIRRVCEELGQPMARVALAWAASRPGVSCVLVGSRKPDQLLRNIEAASLKLSPDVIAQLDAVTEALRVKMGPNADMWDSGANSRIR